LGQPSDQSAKILGETGIVVDLTLAAALGHRASPSIPGSYLDHSVFRL